MMVGTKLLLRDGAWSPHASPADLPERPLNLVVPYIDPALTAPALSAAIDLARGFEALVTLLAVYVLPFPTPLEAQEGIRHRLESELFVLARTSPVSVRVKLVFARDRLDAFLRLLRRESLIVIGTRDHWWRTRETRFARKLAAHGHSVAVIEVK